MTSKKGNFSSMGARLIAQAEQPADESTSKGKVTSFELEPELERKLDRMVFWRPKKERSRKAVINDALRYYYENSPEGQKSSERLTPDEE